MVKSSAAGFARSASPSSPSRRDTDPCIDPEASTSVDPLLGSAISLAGNEAVFPLVQRVSKEVEDAVDTPLSWDQLKSPAVNFSLVRPLVHKLSRGDRPAISLVYGLLLARAHFLERSDDDLAFAAVNTSRADLCELLAVKILSAYGVAPGSLELLHVLTMAFNPFAGATADMFAPDEGVDETELRRLDEFGKDEGTNALELAISSGAKRFVKSPLVQQVIKAIDIGEVIYTPEWNHALIQDTYKPKPVVEVYDWRRRPFLDHHRLRVPRIRGRLEFLTFSIMLALFLITQWTYRLDDINLWEALFIAWGIGFALDEYSALAANGLTTYANGAFNILDSCFCIVFFAYLGMRVVGLRTGDDGLSALSFDTLGLAGCVLLPRLTISFLRHNVVLLALSKMIREFSVFMGLAFLTASGFLCTFRILSRGTWDVGRIAWLMLKIWLGSAFLGFEAAQQFHPVYGPALMVAFAILSQTLLLTILISLLSNTFAAVQANAETEILNQMALRTLERAKADPLTCYVPPLNTLALAILFPLRFLASPRTFHKAQVYLARTLNLPILLVLALSARASTSRRGRALSRPLALARDLPRRLGSWPVWEGKVEQLVGEVWERGVTDAGRRVASIDEPAPAPAPPFGGSNGKDKGKGRKMPPPPLERERAAAKDKDRLGALDSPLARLFGPGASLGASLGSPSAQAQASAETDARLARIEEALQLLLGEVVKTGAAGRGNDDEEDGGAGKKSVPLTGLTGEPEESYADEE
ncbi:hypothetical protein JCM10450v2_002444 [Rhodotorula kratochvilovae]